MTEGKVFKNTQIGLNNHGSIRNDTVAKAIRHAHLIIYSNKHVKDTNDDNPQYSLGQPQNLSYSNELFTPGWTRQSPHGSMCGNSSIDTYENDLMEMFDVGKQ